MTDYGPPRMTAEEVIEHIMKSIIMKNPDTQATQIDLKAMSKLLIQALKAFGFKVIRPPFGDSCRKPGACIDNGFCPLEPNCEVYMINLCHGRVSPSYSDTDCTDRGKADAKGNTKAEVARLRKALERIVRFNPIYHDSSVIDQLHHIARAALKGDTQ